MAPQAVRIGLISNMAMRPRDDGIRVVLQDDAILALRWAGWLGLAAVAASIVLQDNTVVGSGHLLHVAAPWCDPNAGMGGGGKSQHSR